MELISKNSRKKISLLAIFIVIFSLIDNTVHANTFDVSAYKSIQLPEINRKKLPDVIRSKMEPIIQNVIERSPIVVYSPSSKLGFIVKYESKIFDFITKIEVSCAPLTSGLLRCSRTELPDGAIAQDVTQGIYAFGGIIQIYRAIFKPNLEFNYPVIRDIRYHLNDTPALLSPGIDVVLAHSTDTVNIKCLKATDNLAIPAILSEKGKVSLIACRQTGINHNNTLKPLTDTEGTYNPGIYGGALYFWVEDKGIALPSVLFYPNQLQGWGYYGYFDLWDGLENGTKGTKRIQNISFNWVQ
jgi:hypothetical protein